MRQAKPTLTGPYTSNFQSIADLLREADGLRIVQNAETLAAQLRQWLAHPEWRREVGERAKAATVAQRGSTGKTVEFLCERLGAALVAPDA